MIVTKVLDRIQEEYEICLAKLPHLVGYVLPTDLPVLVPSFLSAYEFSLCLLVSFDYCYDMISMHFVSLAMNLSSRVLSLVFVGFLEREKERRENSRCLTASVSVSLCSYKESLGLFS